MTSHRTARVADVIRKTLSTLIREEVRDPRVGAVSITDVRVTTDLRHARVFLSSLDEGEDRQRTLQGLKAASTFLRGAVGREARLKHAPELQFEWDTALETGMRIEQILSDIEISPDPDAEAADPEAGPGEQDPS
ncbi:hypothetical protein ABI59_24045 [Acidobacteria bacterium Mor1]|nr:hypothetical protein ABI59_24045 [Acidobacteria bacterium Mor1]